MRRPYRDVVLGTFVMACAVAMVTVYHSRWLAVFYVVIVSAYGASVAASYWARSEVYRLGGVSSFDEKDRTDEEDEYAIFAARKRIAERRVLARAREDLDLIRRHPST